MNDLISRIERGEFQLQKRMVSMVNAFRSSNPFWRNEEAEKVEIELIRLAKLGQQRDWIPVTEEPKQTNNIESQERYKVLGKIFQADLDRCAKWLRDSHGETWTCGDNSCSGHKYCKAYKSEFEEGGE